MTISTKTAGACHRSGLLPLSSSATITYRRMTVDGVSVFYREAGRPEAPTIVLLHGLPTSSRQFDALIPLLAPYYHVLAPDYPGFGQSDARRRRPHTRTFDQLARTMLGFLEQKRIDRCSFYLHDYGGPIGLRIILAQPERLQALIIQNANAYEEGLGAKWAAIARYWAEPEADAEVLDAFISREATEKRHTSGTSYTAERYNPDTWIDEFAYLSRPGQREIQTTLLYDYRTNIASYPRWQDWLQEVAAAHARGMGKRTIRLSCPRARRLIVAMCPMPRSICWTLGTSHSMKSWTRSPC